MWVPWLLLALMTISFAVVFSALSVMRHTAYQSHAYDLGNMDQAVWNTLHGHFLRFTDMSVGQHVLTTRLAIHVEPILALFAPLYIVHGGPETLLLGQVLIVATGAIPAYLLARWALGRPWLALAFPLAYLLHPSLQNAVLDDFHAVTLSASFLLWALYFAVIVHPPGFAVTAILAASTKEEVGLLVAMLGLVFLLRRRWYAGFMAIICGVGWFLMSVLLIIPASNPAGQSPYLERYRYLGHGLGGILSAIVRRPETIAHVLTSAARLHYVSALLHPVGFVSILSLPVLLLALPSFLINMLSADPRMYSGFYQYPTDAIPFVVGAAAIGIGIVGRLAQELHAWRARLMVVVLCGLVLLAAIVDTRRLGFSPLADGYLVPTAGSHQRLEDRLLEVIPPGAMVSAADEIEPHLSGRYWVYKLPTVHPKNAPAAGYIALDASIPALPVRQSTLHAAAMTALRGAYGVARAQDGILVLRRGAARKTIPRTFYSFVFVIGANARRERAHWGPLNLVGVTIHPRDGEVNRARPAIGLETYWRCTQRLAKGTSISIYVSPVYQGGHPVFSSTWTRESESPTWDWLPLAAWPVGRTIRALSVPVSPDTNKDGSVDLAVGVSEQGVVQSSGAAQRVKGAPRLLRLATIRVHSW